MWSSKIYLTKIGSVVLIGSAAVLIGSAAVMGWVLYAPGPELGSESVAFGTGAAGTPAQHEMTAANRLNLSVQAKITKTSTKNSKENQGKNNDLERFHWMMNCQGCHGQNGEASVQRSVPSLDNLAAFQKIPAGREFLIRVPGVSHSPLSDSELANLLNWMVRTMGGAKTMGGTMGPAVELPSAEVKQILFTREEVAALRKNPFVTEIREVRRNLISRINSDEAGTNKNNQAISIMKGKE